MAELLPFMKRLHITSKEGDDLVLGDVLTWPQLDLIDRVEQQINNGEPNRFIILKARQIGMSTIIEGLMFLNAMARQNFAGTVMAHTSGSSEWLLKMTRYYFESFWGRDLYTQSNRAAKMLGWTEPNSVLQIATAGSKEAGRGRTPQWLHASEVAFWENAKTLMTGMANSIGRAPKTAIFLESTANGVGGYYYDIWNAATMGENRYIPLFYPWWAHPNYTAHHIGLGGLAEGVLSLVSDEERDLVKFLKKDRTVNGQRFPALDNGEIKSRVIWRREILGTECEGDLNKLHQEYPSTPEEAFVATGTNVFNLGYLNKIYEPINGDVGRLVRDGGSVRFIKDIYGELEIFRHPGPSDNYMTGGDGKKAAASVSGSAGDYCCAQVLDRRTWDQAARLRGRWDQNTFGEQMILLGQYYNNAMLAPETQIGGPGVAAHLLARGYPNVFMHRKATKMPGFVDNTFGWISNAQTKAQVVGDLQSALHDAAQPAALQRDLGIRIHDAVTYAEMKNYITLPNGGFGNADGVKEHDDTVMALGIALTCTKLEAAAMGKSANYVPANPYSKLSPEDGAKVDEILEDLGVEEGGWAMGGHKLMLPGDSWDDGDDGGYGDFG